MTEILQAALPDAAHERRPLPNVTPIAPDDWLVTDEAFAAQMARRDTLVTTRREAVIALFPEAHDAATELLETVLTQLSAQAEYKVSDTDVLRPDGVRITLNSADPLGTLGRLIQEDLCLLQTRGTEHVLVGAVLCFPASWRLSDKIGRPLTTIHAPITEYDTGVARRVQRLFDGVREGRPLRRQNLLTYADPELHQPYEKAPVTAEEAPYLRSERQVVLRLPRTRAVVFSIHSYVVRNRDTA